MASHRSYESAREAYEMILTQMQTDYLDLLLIHWPAAQGEPMVWQAQNAGAWRALEELYTEGASVPSAYPTSSPITSFRCLPVPA